MDDIEIEIETDKNIGWSCSNQVMV